jgi:hypothetical protein
VFGVGLVCESLLLQVRWAFTGGLALMVLFTGVNFYIAKRIGRLTGEMMAKKVGCLPSGLHLHFIAGNCVCVCACVLVRACVRTWTHRMNV